MAYTNIDLPTDYFNTKLYTGTGATQSITGVGFQPDWVWIKDRTNAYGHDIYDVIRTATYRIQSNDASAESTASGLTSFNSDGFTLGSYIGNNTNTANYVSWNWKANGTGVSNTSGSISSTVSANTTSGFSVVSYTGNGTSGATVGHGLGVAPKFIIIKRRDGSEAWPVWSNALAGNTSYLRLNATDAVATATDLFNSTTPTSSLVTLGNGGFSNTNTWTYIMYCFAEVKGYSKFGSYTGNGNADGTFVYLGFRPAFVIRKRTDTTADWRMDDSKRDGYNVIPHTLFPNYDNAETTNSGYNVDLLSNGFKCRATSGNQNASGGTYIYMAFAENPFVSSKGIPSTAR